MDDTVGNGALVRRLFDEWINKKNLAAIDEMVSPDYVSHESGVNNGAAETKVFLSALLTAFPDLQVTVEDMVAAGDKVVVRNTWRGTHRGPFLGIAATGKSMRIEGIVIWRVENRKVAERWATLDYLSLMRQLGVVATPAR
jgi:steroid delta-isomerase-like uncharacterized protein